MNIVTAINKGYIQHFCSMASSVISNNSNEEINFFVIHMDLDIEDQEYIKYSLKSINIKNVSILFIVFESKLLDLMPVDTGIFTSAAMYRIYLEDILPLEINKVLYLDSDIIVNDNLTELYNTDIDEYYIAAVEDFHEFHSLHILDNKRDYFNSGVLLINLKKWRDDNFLRKCVEYTNINFDKIILPDQDILNGTLNGNWKRLGVNWNVTTLIFNNDVIFEDLGITKDVQKAKDNPSIIHYTTIYKPWKFITKHPFKDRYFYFLDKTNYEYEKYPEITKFNLNKFIIFGASNNGIDILDKISNLPITVLGFSDNDEQKWGSTILGLKVYPPTELSKGVGIKVIIASQYRSEISDQLESMGLRRNVNYYYSFEDFISCF
jgi:lipopolysaccharide biosynthesis glycosyltransferase